MEENMTIHVSDKYSRSIPLIRHLVALHGIKRKSARRRKIDELSGGEEEEEFYKLRD